MDGPQFRFARKQGINLLHINVAVSATKQSIPWFGNSEMYQFKHDTSEKHSTFS
jgi:hypothetical protein